MYTYHGDCALAYERAHNSHYSNAPLFCCTCTFSIMKQILVRIFVQMNERKIRRFPKKRKQNLSLGAVHKDMTAREVEDPASTR